ncbi:MAG: hypothetical protein KJZ85_02220 [Rhodobacteraceae bacterium]|jgi:hypothetical protein|nr:hypothetical protein [Paracoccaceae bacterium]
MLHVDIPTAPELRALIAARDEAAVSIYLPVTPETQAIGTARIRLGQLAREAAAQLEAAGRAKRTIWPVTEQIDDLAADDDFWAHQANGLAIFVTPSRLAHYRLPTRVTEILEVSDRFHIKPLLRAASVDQHAFVLAISEGGVRVVEVLADLPARAVKLPGLPRDAASAAGTTTINDRFASDRIHGAGQPTRLRQYARKVDAALRGLLAGREEPLIVAAAEPMLSVFRSVNTYAHLAPEAIAGNPEHIADHDLGARARGVLDAAHARKLAGLRALLDERRGEGRATTDIADAARAATFGAVDTLLVDIDRVVPGTVDAATGAVTFAVAAGADSYGIVDEIAGRVILSGGQVLGVRRDDLPDGAALAAILRYPV